MSVSKWWIMVTAGIDASESDSASEVSGVIDGMMRLLWEREFCAGVTVVLNSVLPKPLVSRLVIVRVSTTWIVAGLAFSITNCAILSLCLITYGILLWLIRPTVI